MVDTYSIGDIAAAHNEKTRTIQFWADTGVLQPIQNSNRKGKGTQRRFDETELRLAGLAKRLAAMNSPVGELVSICTFARNFTVSGLARRASKLYDSTQEKYANKKIDPLSAIENYYLSMSLAGVAGIYSGQIRLIINYYLIGSEVKSAFLFAQEGEAGDIISRKRGEIYIGYKSIAVDVERDLRFRHSPNQEERASCEQICWAAVNAITAILDELEQPFRREA